MRKHKQISLLALVVCLSIIFTSAELPALVETGGIGIKIGQLFDHSTGATDHRGSIVVLDVFMQSPAEKAGIEKGDVILKVNDVITKNNDFRDILENHLRSPSNTEVILLIWRCRTKEKLVFKITREPIVY